MRYSGIILIVLGIVLLGYSLTLEPYTNQKAYESAYNVIEGKNKSEQFYELRDIYLTNKYALENYGLTALILGLFSFLLLFNGWNTFKIPKNKLTIAIIGIIAVIVTVFGYVADLFLESSRGSFPHWADSVGIPLTSIPIIFMLLSSWYAFNLIGLIKPFKTAGLVKRLNMKGINYWFLTVLLLSLFLTAALIFEGNFWFVAAGILWSFYYLCLLIGRRDGIIEKELQLQSLHNKKSESFDSQ